MDDTPTIPKFLTKHFSLEGIEYDQLRNAIRAKLQRHEVSIDHFATCAAALDVGCCKDTVVNWLNGETKGISCKTAEVLVTMFKLQILIIDTGIGDAE